MEKQKVVFVNARQPRAMGVDTAPLNFLHLAGNLVERYEVVLVDTGVDKEWSGKLNALLGDNPLCVGVSVLGGSSITYGIEASRIIKRSAPQVPVVWGGSHPTLFPEETCREEFVDFVIAGEGEISFRALCDRLGDRAGFEDVPGLAFKRDGQVVFKDDVRFVDFKEYRNPPLPYELIDCDKYSDARAYVVPGAKRVFGIETSRGCPHTCLFCSYYQLCKREWRPIPLDFVLEQIVRLNHDHAVDGFRIVDSNFFVDKRRVRRFCERLLERRIAVKWAASGYIRHFKEFEGEILELLQASGCVAIVFGAESGSDRMLQFYRKRVTAKDIVENNKRFRQYAIIPRYSFMAGAPGETDEDIGKTLEVITEIFQTNPKSTITNISIYTPWGGSELYTLCLEKYGFKPPKKLEEWSAFNFDSGEFPWNPPERVSLLKKLHYASFFLTVRPEHLPMNVILKAAYWVIQRLILVRLKYKVFYFCFEANIARYFVGSGR